MIRPAGPSHAAVMAAIHAACFPPSQSWTSDALAGVLQQPGVFALLDEDGAFVLARVAADEAEILTLAVLPALRREGRGGALLADACRAAKAAGAQAMFLEVSSANVAALALYAAGGFREVGRRRDYYAPDEPACVLRLELTPFAATML